MPKNSALLFQASTAARWRGEIICQNRLAEPERNSCATAELTPSAGSINLPAFGAPAAPAAGQAHRPAKGSRSR